MKDDEVKLEPFEEVALLMCYRAIVISMELTDTKKGSHMAKMLYGMISDRPGIFSSIKVLVADLLEDAELDKNKVMALRLLLDSALARAERKEKGVNDGEEDNSPEKIAALLIAGGKIF